MRNLATALLVVVVLFSVGCDSVSPTAPPTPTSPVVWRVEYTQWGLSSTFSNPAGGVYLGFHGEASVFRSNLIMGGTLGKGNTWTWEGNQELLEQLRGDGITTIDISDTFRPVIESGVSYPIRVSIWRDGQLLSSAESSIGTVHSIGGGNYAAKFYFKTMEQVELVVGPGIPQ